MKKYCLVFVFLIVAFFAGCTDSPENIDISSLELPTTAWPFHFIPHVTKIEEFTGEELINTEVVEQISDNTRVFRDTEHDTTITVVKNEGYSTLEYVDGDFLSNEYFMSYNANGQLKETVSVYHNFPTREQRPYIATTVVKYLYNNGLLERREKYTDTQSSKDYTKYDTTDNFDKKITETYKYDELGRVSTITYITQVFAEAIVDKYEYLNETDYNIEPYSGMLFYSLNQVAHDRKEHRVKQSGRKVIVTDRVLDDGEVIDEITLIWKSGKLVEFRKMGDSVRKDSRTVLHY